jgi:hypothetical protein
VTCTASDQCHDVGTCDPTSGVCSTPAKANGATCDDGNACTRADTCQSGACVGGNPVTCLALDQCHDVGKCDPGSGVCSNPTLADGTGCSDANACTRGDTCQGGTCTPGAPVVCTAQGQCLQPGVCDPVSGTCSTVAQPDGTTCDDGDVCSTNDACRAGTCAPGSSACVSLSFAQVAPGTKRLTVQLAATLAESPTVAVPGDPVLFTATVTNTGTLVEIANGEIDISNTVVPNPNVANDGRFSVAGYQVSLEAQSFDGTWSPIARFERDNNGAIVTPAAPIVPIQTFNPSLIQPATGVTPAPAPPVSPDALFRALINAGATGRWSYNFSANLPPSAVQLLFDPTLSQGVRVTFHFDTSVSKKPFDGTSPPADLTKLLAGFTGTVLSPSTTITFAGLTGGGTLPSQSQTIPPGATVTMAGAIPAAPFAARGAAEPEAAYLSRLAGSAYQVRAHATGQVAAGQQPAVDFGGGLSASLPIISTITKAGLQQTVIAGQSAQYSVSLRNTGSAVAGPFTITDTVGGQQVPASFSAPPVAGPGQTVTANLVMQSVPAGVATLTDIAVVSWLDRNGNAYGTISSNAFTSTVQAQVMTAAAPLVLSDPQAPSTADLVGGSAFVGGGFITATGAQGVGAFAPTAGAGARASGRVTVDATDLGTWLAGVPVTVGRRYDSAAGNAVGDFGHGWSLALEPRAEIDAGRNATLAMGDGRRLQFGLGLSPYSSALGALLEPRYAAAGAGATGQLTSDGCALVTMDAGKLVCFMGGGQEFTPSTYTYAEPGGRVFTLGAAGEPRSITSTGRDGATVSFGREGVFASTGGRTIRFERDAQERIAQVIVHDPAAGDRAYLYHYDQAGDLRAVGSPQGALIAEYAYDGAHRLRTLRDAGGATRTLGAEGAALTQRSAPSLAPALDAHALSCAPSSAASELMSGAPSSDLLCR